MKTILTALVLSLCFSSGILLRYIPFKKIVTQRQKWILFVGYVAALVINALIIIPIYVEKGIEAKFIETDMFIISACTTLLNICVIRKHIKEHLFVFGLVLVCNSLAISIPVRLLSVLVTRFFSLELPSVLYGVFMLVAVYRPIRGLLLRTVEPFLSLDSGKYWNTVWFIPFAQYFALIFALPAKAMTAELPEILCCTSIGVAMILMCLSVARDHILIQEQEHRQKLLTDQKLHYAQMQQYVEDARTQHHDLKHHIAAIQRFIDADDKAGLQEYANQFLAQAVTNVTIPYTGNTAADGVIYRYMQLAEQNNVDFHYAGKIYSKGITDMDLCVLLGNALDNALAGCLTVPKNRSISLVSSKEEGLLSIMVHNSFDGKIEKDGDAFLSRKRDKVPGVGMHSMQTICKRYGGTMQTSWDEDTFSVIFLLPVQ